jgi:hypothetical protein
MNIWNEVIKVEEWLIEHFSFQGIPIVAICTTKGALGFTSQLM